uniref:tRNA-dihydrouridine(47) synthase [NAD(P)(+)] n=1 Tax=Chromera velia CCMP2878 TaxID=1169474 RepID=A0A0G4G9V8_9ALVE|eukprot:Cvel_4407.t1-p1 / transcript=Cvel_4407.t1 / gene=Cvel_4407 / organism=Chromera_velia_CCMP2878 / gene_product=tRNA-dihydrouridine(47) synthase [NAD(P)( )]-like, putative / transcript_product=tRNA-dihydrouridine(47) synthase [NAD(P)( )]-like, putative / location=Cvel_scaffold191:102249-110973(-) / protein_length=724 / sequence_SO=supercontig / SO=protein_coding / is_pseudo=false
MGDKDEAKEYVEACLQRGDAPIKKEFLLPPVTVSAAASQAPHLNPPQDAPIGQTDSPAPAAKRSLGGDEQETAGDGQKPAVEVDGEPAPPREGGKHHPKRQRGQNKPSERTANSVALQMSKSAQICTRFSQLGECSFGDECVFGHDINEFLSKKGPDLGETCPIFSQFGFCSAGVNCRWGKQHLSSEGRNLCRTEGGNLRPSVSSDLQELEGKKGETGGISSDVRTLLRKKKVPLQKSQKFLREWEKEGKAQQKKGNGSCPKEEEGEGRTEPNRWEPQILLGSLVTETWREERERKCKRLDLRGKMILAPLTTVGNLPFRRLCCKMGVDVTVSEMAMASSILEGKTSELALLKRHADEKIYGIQVAGGYPDVMTKCAEFLDLYADCDFVDINMGCPLEALHQKGAGCFLMMKERRLEGVVRGMSSVMRTPLTIKMRTAFMDKERTAHLLVPKLKEWGVQSMALHGRTAKQRYTKCADWAYISTCARAAAASCASSSSSSSSSASPVEGVVPLAGNGDVFSFEDAERGFEEHGASAVMVGRGALIKPWIFTEIKERRHWDISASERLDVIKDYVKFGLEHWGSDDRGIASTRRFLLEWLSFLHRYIPVGLLERVPQHINWRPPPFVGRSDLETKLASPLVKDWIEISEMFLGPIPQGFSFIPKHKSNAYNPQHIAALEQASNVTSSGLQPEKEGVVGGGGGQGGGERSAEPGGATGWEDNEMDQG